MSTEHMSALKCTEMNNTYVPLELKTCFSLREQSRGHWLIWLCYGGCEFHSLRTISMNIIQQTAYPASIHDQDDNNLAYLSGYHKVLRGDGEQQTASITKPK